MIRPVKVLGFPRSGTSLLQRLFATHPQLYCPPETYVFSGCARMIRDNILNTWQVSFSPSFYHYYRVLLEIVSLTRYICSNFHSIRKSYSSNFS